MAIFCQMALFYSLGGFQLEMINGKVQLNQKTAKSINVVSGCELKKTSHSLAAPAVAPSCGSFKISGVDVVLLCFYPMDYVEGEIPDDLYCQT